MHEEEKTEEDIALSEDHSHEKPFYNVYSVTSSEVEITINGKTVEDVVVFDNYLYKVLERDYTEEGKLKVTTVPLSMAHVLGITDLKFHQSLFPNDTPEEEQDVTTTLDTTTEGEEQ